MHSVCSVACVAGVRKGRGRELGGETAREGGGRREEGNLSFLPRAPKFPLPLPLLTPATQAMCSANNGLCQC